MILYVDPPFFSTWPPSAYAYINVSSRLKHVVVYHKLPFQQPQPEHGLAGPFSSLISSFYVGVKLITRIIHVITRIIHVIVSNCKISKNFQMSFSPKPKHFFLSPLLLLSLCSPFWLAAGIPPRLLQDIHKKNTFTASTIARRRATATSPRAPAAAWTASAAWQTWPRYCLKFLDPQCFHLC